MNKKNRPDVLRDAAKTVGGADKRKTIETPKASVKQIPSVPGRAKPVRSQYN